MTEFVAALLVVCSFAFYLHGLYPSLSVGDSGEFITAAWTLGVPHAPGFPVYTLLGHLFADVIPWGNAAYRLNLCSAAAASMAIGLFFLALRRHGIRWSVALECALMMMVSSALAANARASEVFALNALFIVGIVFAALERRWILAFFLVGLGAGNHQIVLFLLPVLLLVFWQDGDMPDKRRQSLWSGAFFLCGLLVYGILLLRAQRIPFLDVGHPQTLEGLWRVMRRADFGSFTLALGETPARTVGNTVLQLKRLGFGLAQQSNGLLLVMAFVGAVWAYKHSRRLLILYGLGFVMLGPVFFLLGNLPFDAQSNGLLLRFLIAPTIAVIFFSAFGFEALFKRSPMAAALILVLALGWQTVQADWNGFRNDFMAYAYGRNTLRTLPHAALFIMDGGDDTFYTLSYLTQVERRRGDVSMHDRGGVVFANPYGPDFRQLPHDDKEARRQVIEQALAASSRPLYYSTMNQNVLPNVKLQQTGLLYAAHQAVLPENNFWPLYDFRGVPPWNNSAHAAAFDYRTRALTPFYAYQKAIDLMDQGQLQESWSFLKSALQTGPDVIWLVPNILYTAHRCAYNAFNTHNYRLARDLYQWILHLRPEDDTAKHNLDITEERLHAHH